MSQYYTSKPQSIYAVSVDSRSRKPGEPINDYVVNLGDVVQRVKSIQVGSILLPDAARDAFPRQCTIPLSEPLDIPTNCRLVIQEVTKVTSSNGPLTITTADFTVFIPPTLNPVTGFNVGTGTLTTAYPHYLNSLIESYPPQLSASMVGTAFPWSSSNQNIRPPLLHGLNPPNIATETNISVINPSVNTEFTFKAGYLDAINGGAVTDATKFLGTGYTSYVFTQRPCISELVQIINTQLSLLKKMVTNVSVSLNDETNSLVFQATTVQSVRKTGSVIENLVTTAQIIASPPTLNEPASQVLNNLFESVQPCNLSGTGAAFPLVNFWQVHTPVVPPGTYAPSDIQTQLTQLMSPLRIDDPISITDPNTTSFFITTPGGAPVTVTLIPGRYTGEQLANHIQYAIAAATGTNGATGDPANMYRVEFIPREYAVDETGFYGAERGGRFTFWHVANLQFALAFVYTYTTVLPAVSLQVNNVGPALGFYPIVYTGAATYTSPNFVSDLPLGPVDLSFNITTPVQRYQRDAYAIFPLPIPRKFGIGTVPPMSWYTTGVSNVTAAQFTSGSTTVTGWQMLHSAITGTYVVPGGYHPGEVLQVQATSGSSAPGGAAVNDTLTVLVAKPWDGMGVTGSWTTFVPTASIMGGYTGGPISGALDVTGPTATRALNVWSGRRSAFQLQYASKFAPVRQLGFSRQTYPVLKQVGQIAADGAAFPPSFNNRGTGIYTQEPPAPFAPVNIPSAYVAPYSWDLLAPRYILMIIRAANPPSKRQTHVYKEDSFPILAKFIMPDATNFIRVTEDMTNYVFTDFERLKTIRVTFLYGDGTPVDFNGHDHTFTLLFTTAQGESDAICL